MHHSHGGLSGIYAVTLPPLNTLPSWSRSTLHNKHKLSLQPDKLKPLAACTKRAARDRSATSSTKSSSPVTSDKEENVLHVLEIYKQKVKYLTGNIDFLKDEHGKVLKSLHEEIERMKYENKELKFKLIISDSNPRSWIPDNVPEATTTKAIKSAVSSSASRFSNKISEDEVVLLKENLAKERNKNMFLKDQISNLESMAQENFYDNPADEISTDLPGSIEECYAVISTLRSDNDAQQKEIVFLQSRLHHHKADSQHSVDSDSSRFMSSLPALRPALQSKVVHRMKRQQLITKEKNRNEILREL